MFFLLDRVATITILMTHFISTKTNYAIPLHCVMMLAILVSWSPKIWRKYVWKDSLFATLFQDSTSIFEWLFVHGLFFGSFCLDESGLSCTCASFFSTESKSFKIGPLLSYNGNKNPLAFLVYPLVIIAHFTHDLGTNAFSVLLKVTKGIGR
jgi:hypothetical protein